MRMIKLLIIFALIAPFSAVGAEVSGQSVSELMRTIQALTEQVRVLQAQVQMRTSEGIVSEPHQQIKVETLPVSADARAQLDRFAVMSAMTDVVSQMQSASPEITLISQYSPETWHIGDDFMVSWQISGFGNSLLNGRNVDILLYDALGVQPQGYLCRKCATERSGLYGNTGSVTGRVGVLVSEEKRFTKIQPGYYRVQVRDALIPGVQSMSNHVITVALPKTSQNLTPSIIRVDVPASIRAGKLVVFKVEAYDPDGSFLSYRMEPGDGVLTQAYLTGSPSVSGYSGNISYSYMKAGVYEAVFSVMDERGAVTRASQFVTVTEN